MAAQKVIFHIGTTKTGTTSIQHSLVHNHSLFLDQFSLYVPRGDQLQEKMLDKEKGGKIFVGGGNFKREIIKAFKGKDLKTAESLLTHEFRQASLKGADTTIYSAEVLFGLGESVDACKSLYKTASQFFDQVQLICCIRPPLDHTASQYSEYVKRRKEVRPLNDCLSSIFLNVGSRLQSFIQAFGSSNISIMSYEDPSQESIAKRFFSLVDRRIVDDSVLLAMIENMPRLNRSLSPLDCEAARLFNQLQINFDLRKSPFIYAYNSYLAKSKKNTLRAYHHLSESAFKKFGDLNSESLDVVNRVSDIAIPLASTRLREGMLGTSEQFSVEEQAGIQEAVWHMLNELNATF